tara:strand:+ start:269 stop:433 length:165 start_codon:yes stop_codon:yes gene_type:complete
MRIGIQYEYEYKGLGAWQTTVNTLPLALGLGHAQRRAGHLSGFHAMNVNVNVQK